jgi:hypothetical protein
MKEALFLRIYAERVSLKNNVMTVLEFLSILYKF